MRVRGLARKVWKGSGAERKWQGVREGKLERIGDRVRPGTGAAQARERLQVPAGNRVEWGVKEGRIAQVPTQLYMARAKTANPPLQTGGGFAQVPTQLW